MTNRHEVCPASELPPGQREIVEIEGHSIGVFNVDGKFYALANVCPHQLAPLCEGRVTGEMVADEVGEFRRVREGEVVQCPWHGWKFDIATGESVFNPHTRTRTYEVGVEPSADDSDVDPPADDPDVDPPADDCAVDLAGDPPPIDRYDVAVEQDVVVVYL